MYKTKRLILYNEDCLTALSRIPSNYVQCCITSPPYYMLRDYEHEGQIGQEESLAGYISNLVQVFDQVFRVLRPDGILWLNVGDSYARAGGWANNGGLDGKLRHESKRPVSNRGPFGNQRLPEGYRQKDLLCVPWTLAFALRGAGWRIRQDIIWHKPNSMPEAVKDRCTRAHEYLFLLTKSDSYYYNNLAIAERAVYATEHARKASSWGHKKAKAGTKLNVDQYRVIGNNKCCTKGGLRNKRSVWTVNVRPYKGLHCAVFPTELIRPCVLAGTKERDIVLDPFMGSGTTGVVATQEHRRFVGIELNTKYYKEAARRIEHDSPNIKPIF